MWSVRECCMTVREEKIVLMGLYPSPLQQNVRLHCVWTVQLSLISEYLGCEASSLVFFAHSLDFLFFIYFQDFHGRVLVVRKGVDRQDL
ncbi:unnamed protein product [Linum tenue]|uniref:Uncharacterized protein n=1 Tax=Linum tenue TaxID=586396 RepID=A0AAV0KRR2_9ROSI|nr:unnamed protein product [Linum tenue]